MKNKGPRTPFDHVKDIYGDNLEKYSYKKVDRDPEANARVVSEGKMEKNRYENIRGKIIDFVLLVFIFFMLGMGVYFILTSIAKA